LFLYEWFFSKNACDIIFKTAEGCENMRKLQAFFHRVKPKRILDVATGNGSFVHFIVRLYDDYDVFKGIDISKKGIDTAKASFEDTRIVFEEINVFDMVDEKFDVVILSNSLHHFDDLDRLFKQLESLLAPGGYLLINEMMSDGLSKAQKSHMRLHHFAAEIDRFNGRFHLDTMKSKEILEVLQKSSTKDIFDAWDMVVPVEREASSEDLHNIEQTIDRLVDKLEDPSFQASMRIKGDKLKKYIHKKGFELATQMLVIMGEKL
jgi:2-polyprenyl-3-methyl-5-hydroxy-6-metoxy-1,4-benzoquinol methylase